MHHFPVHRFNVVPSLSICRGIFLCKVSRNDLVVGIKSSIGRDTMSKHSFRKIFT